MGECVRAGLKMLADEFRKSTTCSYDLVPIEDGGWPVSDVATEEEAAALTRTLYRKKPSMAAYGMVVAQLLFDDGPAGGVTKDGVKAASNGSRERQ